MAKNLTPDERKVLADKAGISDAYLYQCLSGRRDLGPVMAVKVEAKLDGALMRWDLCPNKWHLIWPEFIGKRGAPAVPKVTKRKPLKRTEAARRHAAAQVKATRQASPGGAALDG